MSDPESSIAPFPGPTAFVPDDAGPAASAFREPPHNLEAEQALLGAILVNNRSYERVSEFLRPEHFADPVHGRLDRHFLAFAGPA